MSTSDADDRRRRLLDRLDAELLPNDQDPELSRVIQRAQTDWLAKFRAGALPFQQDGVTPGQPLADEVEHWLLLETEKTFRSGTPGEAAAPPGLRVASEFGVVNVRQIPGSDHWEVRLRRAAPGTYRIDVSWQSGVRQSVTAQVTENASGFMTLDASSGPPDRVLITPLQQ